MKLKDKLIKMNACSDAVEWVGRRSLKTAWAECERGDWMLWLAGRAGIDRKTLVLAACDCAEMALKYVPEGENRPANAIKITRAWAEGNATIEEVREARKDAAYAVCAAYAAYAAACAADADSAA